MSAEGKKKHGVAGMSNAANMPFRRHGGPKDYSLSTAIGRSAHPRNAGAKFLHAMELAAGLGFEPTDRAVTVADRVIDYMLARHPGDAKAYTG